MDTRQNRMDLYFKIKEVEKEAEALQKKFHAILEDYTKASSAYEVGDRLFFRDQKGTFFGSTVLFPTLLFIDKEKQDEGMGYVVRRDDNVGTIETPDGGKGFLVLPQTIVSIGTPDPVVLV
jgi:hypothetical protein